jgi:hypothetical protein
MAHEDLIDAELSELLRQTDIDLSTLPAVMNTTQLASVLGMTPAALAQDRYRYGSIPWVKLGRRRVRYLRSDVLAYLIANRNGD